MTRAWCQVLPPSNDTDTFAPVTRAAFAVAVRGAPEIAAKIYGRPLFRHVQHASRKPDAALRVIEVPPPMPARIAARVPARGPINKKAVACATCMLILPPVLGAAFLTFYGGFIILFLFAFAGLVVASGP